MEEDISMQAHINKLHMIVDQLASIDHPISYEDWHGIYIYREFVMPSFHTLVSIIAILMDYLWSYGISVLRIVVRRIMVFKKSIQP
jgi:hypothetical protein